MAAAFAAFGGGTAITPIAIAERRGHETARTPRALARAASQMIDPKYANTMNYALSNVWKGTAEEPRRPALRVGGQDRYDHQNENTWFVGYTPLRRPQCGSATPRRRARAGRDRRLGVGSAYGSTIAAHLEPVHDPGARGRPTPTSPQPADKVVFGEKIPVPSVIGMTEADARERLSDVGFNASIAPEQVAVDRPRRVGRLQNPSGTAIRGSSSR